MKKLTSRSKIVEPIVEEIDFSMDKEMQKKMNKAVKIFRVRDKAEDKEMYANAEKLRAELQESYDGGRSNTVI